MNDTKIAITISNVLQINTANFSLPNYTQLLPKKPGVVVIEAVNEIIVQPGLQEGECSDNFVEHLLFWPSFPRPKVLGGLKE